VVKKITHYSGSHKKYGYLFQWPVAEYTTVYDTKSNFYKKLSCRKETVRLLRGSGLAKYNWKTIFRGHYKSIFNHCDVIGPQSYQIRWNNAK